MRACIGDPISWLRLELSMHARDAAVDAHVEQCDACRHCLTEIRRDLVALPGLPEPVPSRRTRWWRFALPALAAAAIAIVVLRPREPTPRSNVATIKGGGEVVLGLVRERGGTIRDDVATFAPGDRWKIEVTCGHLGGAWVDLAVVESGATVADHPLAPALVVCGNKIDVPGAFALTGGKPQRVCIRVAVATDAPPPRGFPRPGEPDVACLIVTPE